MLNLNIYYNEDYAPLWFPTGVPFTWAISNLYSVDFRGNFWSQFLKLGRIFYTIQNKILSPF